MARKEKQPLVPTQYKHLRFADGETGDILNFGGFTLAYRCTQQPSEVAGRPTITAEYAYAECSINDNFDKTEGRKRTYNRLMHKAPNFYESFDITPQLPEGYEHHIIDLGEGIVDVSQDDSGFDLQRAIVERFLAVFAAILNIGTEEEGAGNLLENLFVTEAGKLAINSEVLSYVEPAFENVAREVATTVIGFADEAIDTIDGFDPSAVLTAADLEPLRTALSSIKDLCSTMVAASDELIEEESDEEDAPTDDEDADELDTEEDDGGVDDEEESDEDDEDESDEEDDAEESDDEAESDDEEDEGDDNPR